MKLNGWTRLVNLGLRAYRLLDGIRERNALVRYLSAACWVTVAFLFQYSLDPVFHHRVAFTFFVTSALLAAWSSGAGPGLCALIAGFVMADYFFVPPVGSLGKYGRIEWALLAGNAVPGLLGIFLFESLHRVRARLAARTALLEAEVARRIKAEADLRAAQQQLRSYTLDLELAVRERTGDLNEAVSFLERFCYTIAHDLRAPARALTGFVSILEQELPNQISGDAQMAARQISASARRMDKLILDLLEYGHISHIPLHPREVALQKIVAAILENLRDTIESTQAVINVDAPLHCVYADPELLRQATTQIVINALRFPKPGEAPRVHIWSEERDGVVHLWIADQGIGIEPQYQEKIFGPFQTLSAPQPEHTGIGLAIVRKCVERMRARVSVDSQPGNGATFGIEFPPRLSNVRSRERPVELSQEPASVA